MLTIEKLPERSILLGHQPGVIGTPSCPAGFQKIYVISSYVPFLQPFLSWGKQRNTDKPEIPAKNSLGGRSEIYKNFSVLGWGKGRKRWRQVGESQLIWRLEGGGIIRGLCFASSASSLLSGTERKSMYNPHRNTQKQTIIEMQGVSLCWITKVKAKENLWDLNVFRKCGLLLWLVRAQHDHYESESDTTSGVSICICLPLRKRERKKISRFSFVIVSVRMVFFFLRSKFLRERKTQT